MELVISSAIIFLMVMDPLGNIPLFLTALRHVEAKRRRTVIIRELLIALVVMLLFLLGGRQFLALFHLSGPSLSVAGGVILMLIALRMIFPTAERNLTEPVHDEPFIVPLAVPYQAGPSLLAMEVVLITSNPGAWPWYLAALVIAWVISSVVLFNAYWLHTLVGEKVLIAVERLMGMVLVIIATQMTLGGVAEFFGLPHP